MPACRENAVCSCMLSILTHRPLSFFNQMPYFAAFDHNKLQGRFVNCAKMRVTDLDFVDTQLTDLISLSYLHCLKQTNSSLPPHVKPGMGFHFATRHFSDISGATHRFNSNFQPMRNQS